MMTIQKFIILFAKEQTNIQMEISMKVKMKKKSKAKQSKLLSTQFSQFIWS